MLPPAAGGDGVFPVLANHISSSDPNFLKGLNPLIVFELS